MSSCLAAAAPGEATADALVSASLPRVDLVLEDVLAQSSQRQESALDVTSDPYVIASALSLGAPRAQHLALASFALEKGGHALVAVDAVGQWYAGLASALGLEWQWWVLADGLARAIVAAPPSFPVTSGVCYLCIALLQRSPVQDRARLRHFEHALAHYMATRVMSPHATALASTLAAFLYARV